MQMVHVRPAKNVIFIICGYHKLQLSLALRLMYSIQAPEFIFIVFPLFFCYQLVLDTLNKYIIQFKIYKLCLNLLLNKFQKNYKHFRMILNKQIMHDNKSLWSKAKFKHQTFHVLNSMQMSSNNSFFELIAFFFIHHSHRRFFLYSFMLWSCVEMHHQIYKTSIRIVNNFK